MTANTFGDLFAVTTFGESHGAALGVVIDGCPAGIPLSEADFLPELARRRPGQSAVTTARVEADRPELVAGVFEGRTTGMPIAVLIRNEGQRSSDYDHLRDVVRRGHADETWVRKFGVRDHRGGGRSSGRETVARVIAGVVARRVLPAEVRIVGHALRIGPHVAARFEPDSIESNTVRCADPDVAIAMERYVLELKERGDSTGGVAEVRVLNTPPNLGEPVFDKLKARLAAAWLSVGAVTGFAYGAGFDVAGMLGSDYVADRAHFGGMLGGVSTGEELRLCASIKPTTSIGDVARKGRHDPCIVPRVIPVLEAMTAIVLADCWLRDRARQRDAASSANARR
ncbi:MAG: chorismate synthase [Planctomycetes bacterium]|nr:chorismate synthase [Planctomycetota bacterium]